MKRYLFYLPLLGLAPLGYFLGFYLQGLGAISFGVGFLASAISMFVVPWIVSATFALFPKAKTIVRVMLFICAFIVQGGLLFGIDPPGATCEMMGIAHRFRHEFPPDQLRNCAVQLRQKFHAGTLTVRNRNKSDDYAGVVESAVVIDDAELPDSLNHKFQRVFIQKSPVTGDEQVVFALGSDRGIICDNRTNVSGFFVYSIADGVEAYRYQRF
jgi:hypothetical protein